ncbi:MAG: radical SAM protein [Clostridia bacterium]|nr:radical SAM protein [Clostridia bacterium]
MKKFNVGWGLTNKCNMRCQFCYSKQARDELKECTYDDWKKFVDENHEWIDSINYGTGENAILDDFFKIIMYIRTSYPSIKQSLTSNGYVFERMEANPDYMEAFLESIDEVDVSIDFYQKERHIEFRGQPLAYDWALKTLKFCHEHGKLCTIVFVGFEESLQKDNLDGLFKIAKEYDALLRMNIYRPVSNRPDINQRFILSYQTLKNALDYINEKYQIVSLSDILFGTVFAGQTHLKENTGVNSIRILPDGSICPSTYLITEEYRNQYNIKQGRILDQIVFNEFENSVIPKECVGCQYESQCKGGVFDRRILWYGTLEQRDPYCPIRLGKEFPKEYYQISKTKRVSVHDDYLPTLFFKNKE